MTNQAEHEAAVKRLRWKCRRGMLELDVFLNGILDNHYVNFNAEQREQFDEFLLTNDQLMMDWLLNKKQPEADQKDFVYFLTLA